MNKGYFTRGEHGYDIWNGYGNHYKTNEVSEGFKYSIDGIMYTTVYDTAMQAQRVCKGRIDVMDSWRV